MLTLIASEYLIKSHHFAHISPKIKPNSPTKLNFSKQIVCTACGHMFVSLVLPFCHDDYVNCIGTSFSLFFMIWYYICIRMNFYDDEIMNHISYYIRIFYVLFLVSTDVTGILVCSLAGRTNEYLLLSIVVFVHIFTLCAHALFIIKICMQSNPTEYFTNRPPHPTNAITNNRERKKNCSHEQKSKQQKIFIQLPVFGILFCASVACR